MKSITVLTEDKTGIIAQMCEALAAKNINIESFDAETSADKGVIVLTVDKHDEALEVLKNQGLQAVSDESLLIRVNDQPGVIAKIAKRFSDAGVNIKGMRIMVRDGAGSIVAITAEDKGVAAEIVKDVLIK